MMYSSNNEKYMKLFCKFMKIPDERKKITESLIKKGKEKITTISKIDDHDEVINNIVKSISS